MILAAFIIGMALCAMTLALIHAEDSGDKFGSAVAMFAAWCAFGMLLMGGTWGLGIVIPGLLAAVVLVLRTTNFGTAISPLAPYKMPLGIGALVCSVLVWVGVLNMMEGLPNG
ncbi:hypothetical protein [uncultured Litoreibacter sp.]|uniref:hypothetical protein n=1 Tax=uncultured Litoreibacter sp. TaxID=1392394 RepID=UPI0026188CF3|nr:hypothetical protein [uncultured Litoreibacter sp.]